MPVSIDRHQTQGEQARMRFASMARRLPPNLETHTYDVIIPGGGINGTGEARDLALRGMSVLLLDKESPSRATRHNSHLGHGGLRYLPHLELGLVREARREVETLLQIAPHLVRPLSTILPVYQGDTYPRWLLKVGLSIYDWFSGKGLLPKHRAFSKEALVGDKKQESIARTPGLRNDGKLKGGFQYYDTQIAYPERLCIENLRDATSKNTTEQPVHALKHAEVTRIDEFPDHVEVTFKDQLDGTTHTAKARYVVNTTGTAVDSLIHSMNSPAKVKLKTPQMGPTKGTHILVENTLGLKDALYASAIDGRPFFVIPFPAEEDPEKPARYLLIGTTDDKTWKSEYPEKQEVDYLLASTQKLFPQAKLSHHDVIRAFSGFRPLPASDKAAGDVTRKHIIRHVEGSRVFHIIGGKLTTFRSLAEQVGDRLVRALKKDLGPDFTKRLQHDGRSITAIRPLPGGRGIGDIKIYKAAQIPKAAQEYGVSPDVVSELINRYGANYREVLELTRPDPNDPAKGAHLKEPLIHDYPMIKAQVLYAIRYEQAETLMDIMADSLKLDMLPGSGIEALPAISTILTAEKTRLTPADMNTEMADYIDYIAKNHQWRMDA